MNWRWRIRGLITAFFIFVCIDTTYNVYDANLRKKFRSEVYVNQSVLNMSIAKAVSDKCQAVAVKSPLCSVAHEASEGACDVLSDGFSFRSPRCAVILWRLRGTAVYAGWIK